jgi:hypothetical protein
MRGQYFQYDYRRFLQYTSSFINQTIHYFETTSFLQAILSNSMIQNLWRAADISSAAQEATSFHGDGRLITVFTQAATEIYPTSQPVSSRLILKVSSHLNEGHPVA